MNVHLTFVIVFKLPRLLVAELIWDFQMKMKNAEAWSVTIVAVKKLQTLGGSDHKKAPMILYSVSAGRVHCNSLPLCPGGDHRWRLLCSWWFTQREWDPRCPDRTHGFKDDGALRRMYDTNWRTNTGKGWAPISVTLLIKSDYTASRNGRVFTSRILF